MSVRQYIGARYVPRFSEVNNGNWSSVYSYEPLIIVKNGNDYYTSKKSVPVGIQITDTEYWVKTGDYNGAIAGLDTRLTTAEADIDNLQDAVSEIGKKHVIFISDSYSGSGRGGYDFGIFTTFRNRTGFTGENSHLFQAGGVGFANTYGGANFLSLANNAITSLSNIADSITDIIIAGGANDNSYSYDDIYSAKNTVVSTLHSTFTKAKIRVAPVCGSRSHPSRNYLNFNTYRAYTTVQYPYELPILNGIVPMLTVDCFADGDLVHPNAQGVKEIGYLLGSCIVNDSQYGEVSNITNSTTFTPNSGITIAASPYINIKKYINGVIINSCKLFEINGTFSFTWNGGVNVPIGHLSNFITSNINVIDGTDYASSCVIPVMIRSYVSSSEVYYEPAELYVSYDSSDLPLISIVSRSAPKTHTASKIAIFPFYQIMDYRL